jgi:hypothetical protein
VDNGEDHKPSQQYDNHAPAVDEAVDGGYKGKSRDPSPSKSQHSNVRSPGVHQD